MLAAATLVAACSSDAEEFEKFEEFDDFPQFVDGPTITVKTPGTLAELLAQFDAETITELAVRGNLNSDDINTLRNNLPNLAVLDMGSVDLKKLPGTFDFKQSLTAVRLPKNLKIIENYAFGWCNNLTSVAIPQGVTSIGKYAFSECNSLTGKLVIPESVTSIGECAFNACNNLTGDLVIPQGVTFIGEQAFSQCRGLTGKLVIPQGVTIIRHNTFKCCSVTSVTFPESMKSIWPKAFFDCDNLTTIYCKAIVPPSCLSDYNNAFEKRHCRETVLYVPVGTAEAYKAAVGWSEFDNIVEMEF